MTIFKIHNSGSFLLAQTLFERKIFGINFPRRPEKYFFGWTYWGYNKCSLKLKDGMVYLDRNHYSSSSKPICLGDFKLN